MIWIIWYAGPRSTFAEREPAVLTSQEIIYSSAGYAAIVRNGVLGLLSSDVTSVFIPWIVSDAQRTLVTLGLM